MIIPGNGEIASTEGTTQGDPLAMAMYALAITPLIHQLRSSCPCVQQVWFADDAQVPLPALTSNHGGINSHHMTPPLVTTPMLPRPTWLLSKST